METVKEVATDKVMPTMIQRHLLEEVMEEEQVEKVLAVIVQ
tara:strand:- start:367 stop:489 length:123 start_codon:yes stop_codon:yes gene_type:complete